MRLSILLLIYVTCCCAAAWLPLSLAAPAEIHTQRRQQTGLTIFAGSVDTYSERFAGVVHTYLERDASALSMLGFDAKLFAQGLTLARYDDRALWVEINKRITDVSSTLGPAIKRGIAATDVPQLTEALTVLEEGFGQLFDGNKAFGQDKSFIMLIFGTCRRQLQDLLKQLPPLEQLR